MDARTARLTTVTNNSRSIFFCTIAAIKHPIEIADVVRVPGLGTRRPVIARTESRTPWIDEKTGDDVHRFDSVTSDEPLRAQDRLLPRDAPKCNTSIQVSHANQDN